MNKVLLASLFTLVVVPSVSAQTFVWSQNRHPADFVDFESDPYLTINAAPPLEVNSAGFPLWSMTLTNNAKPVADATMLVFNPSTGLLSESHSTRCDPAGATSVSCLLAASGWDRRNKAMAVFAEERVPENNPVRQHPLPPGEFCSAQSGAICSVAWNISEQAPSTFPTGTTIPRRGIETWRVSSTEQGYLTMVQGSTAETRDLVGSADNQLLKGRNHVLANDTGPIAWGHSVASNQVTFDRFNLSSFTETHESTGAGDVHNGAYSKHLSFNTTASDELIFAYSTNAANEQVKYQKISQSAIAVGSAITPTGSRIYDTAERDTFLDDSDTDEAGQLLTCGRYDNGAEIRGFVARFDLATNAQVWNITLDLGSFTQVYSCQFDYLGGFYAQTFHVTDAEPGVTQSSLRRYSGGGFATPTPPGTIAGSGATTTPPTATGTAFPGVPDIDSALVEFGEGIGARTAGGKFLWGLVLLISAFVFIIVLCARLNANPTVPGAVIIAAGVVGLPFLGLWPIFIAVIGGLIAAGIITFIIVRVVGGFGGG